MCARLAFTIGLYRPGLKAGRLPCPILIAIGDHDVVVVNSTTEAAAHLAGERATVKHYPVGHFEIYLGECFERAVSDQVAFLQEAFARHPVRAGGTL